MSQHQLAFPGNKAISFKKDNLYLCESMLSGNGVFSSTDLKKGDIIECCPLLLFTELDTGFLQYTNLYNYYGIKCKENSGGFLALGFGAFYNHSSPSNAEYKLDISKKTITVISVCNINANIEITINYNGKFDDNTIVAFKQKDEIYEFSINLF